MKDYECKCHQYIKKFVKNVYNNEKKVVDSFDHLRMPLKIEQLIFL